MSRKHPVEPQMFVMSDASDEVRETVLIYRLPNFANDRRSDLRAVREKVGSIDDMARFDELFRVYANAPGHYLQEFRLGGQVADTKVIEVKAKVETLSDAPNAANVPAQPETSSAAQPIVAATEMLKAAKDFAREAQPQPATQPTQLTASDVERMISDAVARAVEQYKATQPAQPAAPVVDPFSFVERSLTLQEQMRQQAMANNPAPSTSPPPDPAESFLSQFEKFTEISERINPNNEGRGWFDKVLGTVEGIAKAAPALIQGASLLMPAMPGGVQAMMQGAGASGVAPVAMPQNEQEAFALISAVIVNDLIKGKRPGHAADLVEEQCRLFPQLNQAINELYALEPAQALLTIQQLTGRNDLVSYAHALAYVEGLQDELRPGDDEGEPDSGEMQPGEANIIEMAQGAQPS